MDEDLLPDLTRALAVHGFRPVADLGKIPDALLLLKRQTLNTNRAVVVAAPMQPPADLPRYLQQVRNRAAFRCGFFPFLWGIGIQVVLMAPGILAAGINPKKHIARIDNQWAIIQSLFLVDPATESFQGVRTWGQVITGKYQDAIASTLSCYFRQQPLEEAP